MKNFDLYKAIILGSLLLLPVVGWWWWTIEGQIDIGTKAIKKEQTPSGYLTKIGLAQQSWTTVQRNERKNANLQDKGKFFENKILTSAKGGGIRRDDFKVEPEKPESVPGIKAVDITVPIKFHGKPELPREYIHVLLFNVEAEAPVWRLRHLKMVNVDAKGTGPTKAPPAEMRDLWKVQPLVFARRTPKS